MPNVRKTTILWAGVLTGVASSPSATLNGASNVTVFISTDGAATFGIEVSPGTLSPGRNEAIAGNTLVWYPLYKDDTSAAATIVFAGAGKAALALENVAFEHIRVSSSANVTATVVVNYN